MLRPRQGTRSLTVRESGVEKFEIAKVPLFLVAGFRKTGHLLYVHKRGMHLHTRAAEISRSL